MMNEEEKRRLALAIFEQEQRTSRTLSVQDHANTRLNAAIRRVKRQQEVLTSLAQQGITWNDLKKAYDDAFSQGEKEMLEFRLSFFYSSVAIAFHERYNADSDLTAAFILRLTEIMKTGESEDRHSFVQRCLSETGVDTSDKDIIPSKAKSTRKDAAAIERMKRTGITQKDLEYERRTGYQNGWNREFYLSVCYAAVALTLFRKHVATISDIESFIDRIGEITDEEISTADILARAKAETGVDVGKIAKGNAQSNYLTALPQ